MYMGVAKMAVTKIGQMHEKAKMVQLVFPLNWAILAFSAST